MRPISWQHASSATLAHGERRRIARGAKGEPERSQLVALILGTFRETLGERLSLAEAGRLFGLPETICRVVLDDLVGQNRLRRTNDGRYTMV
jgi:hypothetical protein